MSIQMSNNWSSTSSGTSTLQKDPDQIMLLAAAKMDSLSSSQLKSFHPFLPFVAEEIRFGSEGRNMMRLQIYE